MKTKLYIFLISMVGFLCPAYHLISQTIAEKKAGMTVTGASELSPEMQRFLNQVNSELKAYQDKVKFLQSKVLDLYKANAEPLEYKNLLTEINDAKNNIRILQENWRQMISVQEAAGEGYALWHQPDTTLEQLIIDYGSMDYVYLIPPEVGKINVSVSSNIPIPNSSWPQMLEQILLQNGVSIGELNPYLRHLFITSEDFSDLKLITTNQSDLEVYPNNSRVCFVLSPEPMDVNRIWFFLDKFVNHQTTVLQRVGRIVLLIGKVNELQDLLKIYDFVIANKRELEYKAVPLSRVEAEEMTRILNSIFEEFISEAEMHETAASATKSSPPSALGNRLSKPSEGKRNVNTLNVIAMPKVAQAVFLVGTKEEIEKAEEIIREVEGQIGEARDRTIFWYNVRHSDPEDLAKILEKVYLMMVENRIGFQEVEEDNKKRAEREEAKVGAKKEAEKIVEENKLAASRGGYVDTSGLFRPPFYQQGGYVVNPRPIQPGITEKKEFNIGRDNFIVDPKTGSLVMVVETDIVPKLKDILSKLDIPKKMVQIEVLLFEKKMRRNQNYGLNLFRMGDQASQSNTGINTSAVTWNNTLKADGTTDSTLKGVLEFLFSRDKTSSGIPAFDVVYRFLMSQDDIHINSSPSVLASNQTEAIIAINEELSIKVGTFQTTTTTDGVVPQDAFTRGQYGITIAVTPTIHMAEKDDYFSDPYDYVTLVSDITFDTFAPSDDPQQPNVIRRHITNEASVPDGQSVIIGGLRRKNSTDFKEEVPFLGEIPGLGKLFSTTTLQSEDTDMIVFLTPKIVSDPKDDLAKLRLQELCKRPGDLPVFLYKLNEALEREKNRLFQGSMTMIFGRPQPRYYCEEGEYDGR